jgi:hypothetical protein
MARDTAGIGTRRYLLESEGIAGRTGAARAQRVTSGGGSLQ